MAITKVDPIEKYIEFYKNQLQQGKNNELNALSAEQEYLKQQALQNYSSGLSEVNSQYADLERALLVQKLINERKIAEQNENLGLTNSGRNLSQHAAAQISYSNSLADTKEQKAKQTAQLLQEKLNKLSEIDIDASKTYADIQKEYDTLAINTATSARNDDISAALKEQEIAQKESSSSSGSKSNTKSEAQEYQEILTDGIIRAKAYGSGYLYTFLTSLKLTPDKLPILRTALTTAGVPADFYENFVNGAYENLKLIPIE